MIDIAERRLDKDGLAALLRELSSGAPIPDVIAAHKHGFRHREELKTSQIAGCFGCLKIFDPSLVHEWVDGEQTPLCPFCGIDSLIGSGSGFPIEENFLRRMHIHWFDSPRR